MSPEPTAWTPPALPTDKKAFTPASKPDRRSRLYEPQTSHFEYHEVDEGQWYRRGPPCPTCDNHQDFGVFFNEAFPDGTESCRTCMTIIEISPYGPKQTGKVRVLVPPDADGIAANPYLNPTRGPDSGPWDDLMATVGLHDIGNGRRLRITYGEQLRYTSGWGWLVYDGRRWVRDDIGTVERFAKATLDRCLTLAEYSSTRSKWWEDIQVERKEFERHIRASCSRGKIEAMISMASSEAEIAARSGDFDREPWLFSVKNGVVELNSGTLRPHDPQLYITQTAPHDYPIAGADRGPECPRWMAFLDEITCGDVDLANYLQKAVGYTLTGEVSEQKLFFLYGDGANGKSTFLEVLRDLMGDYSTHLSFEALLKSRNATPEQGFAHLPGKRLATASESGENRSWNEEAVKSITGGDTIRGKFLYKDSFEFRPVAKIWVAANDRPRIDGVNEGIWRRFALIPFRAEIPKDKRDKHLKEKLLDEAPGILAWAVRGAMRWYREGLRPIPACMEAAMEDYRSDHDTLARWIAECCELGLNLSASSSDLLRSHNEWAERNKEPQLTQTRLGTRLGKWKAGRLTKTREAGTGRIRWAGIMLKEKLDQEDGFARGLGRYDRERP